MKVTDYIVDFLARKGITDAFGYPGGSVTNLVDSFCKEGSGIHAHVVYHEQAAAFAACGYSATSGKAGVAYATGGPGATNLITGIGHAYYDSLPVIFLTGNSNTYESKGDRRIRQRAFQESDIVSVVRSLTKYCAYVETPEKIRFYLERAYDAAMRGRRGPVLLDLPMDVQRAQVDVAMLEGYQPPDSTKDACGDAFSMKLCELLQTSKSPCVVLGNAIKTRGLKQLAAEAVDHLNIPCVSSMISFDLMGTHANYMGFIGAYGNRAANFAVAKSDLIIAVGTRLDDRQVGAKRGNFAPNAKILRVDIDEGELEYKIREKDEFSFCMDVEDALTAMRDIEIISDYSHWREVCAELKETLSGLDDRQPNAYVRMLSEKIPQDCVITTDVGQNQVWVAQSFVLKDNQTALFCGGMGAMGHALPAAIGAYYGSCGKTVFSICGDGGLQMNIQELQYLARERLPVKVIVFNNQALGMIRHFQEMYFDNKTYQTTNAGGFTSPAFDQVAKAYGIHSAVVESGEDVERYADLLCDREPALLEIRIHENTYVYPKLRYGNPNQDQEPLLDRELFRQLMEL